MMADGQKIRALSLSQREIAMAQQVRPQSAQNTISLKLYLPDCEPQAVKEAADQVLDSADIFAASLRHDALPQGGRAWQMVYGEEKLYACSVWEAYTAEQVENQMAALDRIPMDMEKQLYHAVVMPLSGGGVYLYVRFHHVIIDGYGMSLFVQRVLDVLGGKAAAESVYAASDAAEVPQNSDDDGFWREYFRDADFEPAIFAEMKTGTETGAHETPQARSEKTTGFDSITRRIPDALMRGIEEFGRREQVTVPYAASGAHAGTDGYAWLLYAARPCSCQDGVCRRRRGFFCSAVPGSSACRAGGFGAQAYGV